MNIFQQRTLEALAEFAAKFKCIDTVYLFGSVARGGTATANDIDVYFQYVPNLSQDVSDFAKFQGRVDDWTVAASERLCRRVRPCCTWYGHRDHEIWQAIQATPVTVRIGKAAMVPTLAVK